MKTSVNHSFPPQGPISYQSETNEEDEAQKYGEFDLVENRVDSGYRRHLKRLKLFMATFNLLKFDVTVILCTTHDMPILIFRV